MTLNLSPRLHLTAPLLSLVFSASIFLSALVPARAAAVQDEQKQEPETSEKTGKSPKDQKQKKSEKLEKKEESPKSPKDGKQEKSEQRGKKEARPQQKRNARKKPIAEEKSAPAPEKSTDDETSRRLDAIEKTLEALTAEIKTLNANQQAALQQAAAKQAQSEAKSAEAAEKQQAKDTGLPLDPAWLENVKWRSLGPANMAGRITDVAIHEKDSSLWWIATAGGGLLKTANQGTSVEHQFDREQVVSIGCVATDPQNTKVLWVGTGEINPRNSVSYGNGIYKSVDGGKTFEHKGLKQSYQIARILVHPEDSDVVYAGVAGRLYGTNSERGVYKTTNGGESWQQVLYVDDQAGVIEMMMHPEDPDTLIVAMWDRMRDGFDSWPGDEPKPDGIDGYDPIRKWGPGGGLYKTTDAGANWKKLSNGLPTGMTGRIGLDWQQKSPHTIYAIIDCEDIGKGPKPFTAYLGLVGTDLDGSPTVTQVLPESPADKAGISTGDVLLSVDGVKLKQFDELLGVLREKKIGESVSLTLQRGDVEVSVATRLPGRPGTRQEELPPIWLGVQAEDTEDGIKLTGVEAKGPAGQAKLEKGDVLQKVDGESVKSLKETVAELQKKQPGDKIDVTVRRGDEDLELTVKLAARPSTGSQTPARSNAFMGIQGSNAEKGGAVLTTITDDGPSEKAGLKAGDIVRKINDKDIADYEALITEIRTRQPDDKMKVQVQRGDKKLMIEVTLGDRTSGSSSDRPYTYSYFGQRPNVQDQQGAEGYKYGGVYKSTDAGETWQRVNSLNVRPMYFSVIKVDPSDDQRVYVLGVSQFQSANGGVTFTSDFGRRVHADGHDLWIDPDDGRHMVIGCDGGFYVTYDRGQNWDHINTAAIGQFYHVTISPRQPYWVAGGLQDNGSWSGPAISRNGGTINEDWINIGGGDGFVCRVDPENPDIVYSESQNGSMSRRNLATGERSSIRPPRVEGVSYRFNWKTPFILSHHNPRIFYTAGNYVFKSLDRGDDLKIISPEIPLTNRGSATALAESPRNPDVLYVGTDDGGLWVTQDGGQDWTDITENLGITDPRWVSTIDASRYEDGRVYVCLDGHRSDDDKPYAFVSEDFGATFQPLHEELPWGSTRCLREDIRNENILYLGTEFALWTSVDRGQNWTQFNQSLPTVAIHEVAQHADVDEIVVATHGRSLWACDVSGLRQLDKEALTASAVLMDPSDVIRWRRNPSRGRTNRRYVSQNPSSGARFWYAIPEAAEKVTIRVMDIEGEVINEIEGNGKPGLHVVTWNLTQTTRPTQGQRRTASGTRGRQGSRRPRPVANGTYRVVLVVDGKELPARTVSVESDPGLPADAVADEEYELRLMQDAEAREEKYRAKSAVRSVDEDD